ncbi:CotH kinase family protein [Mycoplasmatota bacterium WC30]
MKKIAVFLVIFIGVFFVGCDFITTATTETTSSTRTMMSTIINQTTNDITLTTENPNVDDVSYESLFDDSNYKKLIISFSEANFLKLIYDMETYNDTFGSYRDNTIQEVDITYYDGEGNVMEVNEVGFRTKGNIFSRVLPVIKEGNEIVGYQQVSFQLEFNETFLYPVNSTEYNYLKQREIFDLEQLNFKHIRYGDTSAVTESVAYDFYREAGIITSNTSYAIIYFDIEGTVVPYGLFMIQEPIDDVFAERYFGKNEDSSIGDVYKCTWQTEPASFKDTYQSYSLGISDYMEGFRRSYALKTNKDVADFSAFTDFVALVNETSVSNYYEMVSTSLDTDSFAKALAMGFLIGSPDDIRSNANNYYMYFNNGYAYYMPFDMDNSMGYGWNPYEDFGISLDIDAIQLSNPWDERLNEPEDGVLIYNLFNDQDFVDIYLGYLDEYTDDFGQFSYSYFSAEHRLIKELYDNEISEMNHLGVENLSLADRWTPASTYFSEKIAAVRAQLTELGY